MLAKHSSQGGLLLAKLGLCFFQILVKSHEKMGRLNSAKYTLARISIRKMGVIIKLS